MVPIVASIAAGVSIIASGGADPPQITPPVHVTVVATAAADRSFVNAMLGEAAAIWRAAGVTILWRTPPAGRSALRATEITVTLHDGYFQSPDGYARLGWITFVGPEAPEPVVHLSLGNAVELMNRTSSLSEAPGGWREYLLALALGRALAHELGHYLLKSTAHEPRGLMRAARPSSDFFSPSRLGFELTADQRARLADRQPCAHAEAMR
jgi:hypothetical protein